MLFRIATDIERLKALVDASKNVSQASYEKQLNSTSTTKYTASESKSKSKSSAAGAAGEEAPPKTKKGVQSTLYFAPKLKPAAGTQTKLSFGAKPKSMKSKEAVAVKKVEPKKNRQMIAAKGMDDGNDSAGTDIVDSSGDELEVVGDFREEHRAKLVEFLQLVDAARVSEVAQL